MPANYEVESAKKRIDPIPVRNRIVLLLAHGSFGHFSQWEPFIEAVNEQTGGSVYCAATDLSISETGTTYDDDVAAMLEDVGDKENVVLVTQSRANEYPSRLYQVIEPEQLIGAFILNSSGPYEFELYPGEPKDASSTQEFINARVKHSDGSHTIDPETFVALALNTVKDRKKRALVKANVRRQRAYIAGEIPLGVMPDPTDLPRKVILGGQDLIHRWPRNFIASQAFFNIRPHVVPDGCHMLHLSHTEVMSYQVIEFAKEALVKRKLK